MCAQAHVCNYFPFITGKVHAVFINVIHGGLRSCMEKTFLQLYLPSLVDVYLYSVLMHKMG